MNSNQVEVLVNKDNKMYWLLNSIKGAIQNDSLLELLKTVIPLYRADLNKPILKVSNEYVNNSQRSTRAWRFTLASPASEFFLLNYAGGFDWQTDTPSKIMDYLIEEGLDLKQKNITLSFGEGSWDELASRLEENGDLGSLDGLVVEKNEVEPILSLMEGFVNQQRQCYFLGALEKQLPREEFINRISQSGLLHNCVAKSQEKIVQFLIDELKVPVNLENADSKTPLMYCCAPSIYDFLASQKDINWVKTDKDNNDALYYFGLLGNKDVSKELISKTQNIVSELSKTDNSIAETIIESNKKALLAIVNSGKNKKEIEDFIRKTKTKNFNGIVNEKGRTLAQICILNDSWGKYTIFKKGTDKSQRDSRGYSDIDYLMLKSAPKYANAAVEVLHDLLCEVPSDSGYNIIQRFFRLDKAFGMPRWFTEKARDNNNFKQILLAYTDTDFTNQNLQQFVEGCKNNRGWQNLANYEANNVTSLKETIRPMFIHAINNNYTDKLNSIDTRKLCLIIRDQYNPDKPTYKISINIINNLAAIVQLADEYNVNINPLLERVETQCVDFLKSGLDKYFGEAEDLTQYNFQRDTLLRESSIMIDFLIDMGSEKIVGVVNDKYLTKMAQSSQMLPTAKKIETHVLNVNLKDNLEKKSKKMKI